MQPIQLINEVTLQFLVELHKITGSLGLSILLFTFIIRSLLLPLSLPLLNSQKKMKKLQPEVDALKKKHKDDQKAFQMAQLELYKKHNVNPLSGCIPQIVQIVLVLILYRVLVQFLGKTEINGILLNPYFLGADLRQRDSHLVIPLLAGVTQLILSVMILPATETPDIVPNNSKNKAIQEANTKEEEVAEMAATMQKQMVFMMPFSAVLFTWGVPAGIGVYWIATTVFTIIQQLVISGPGGLTTYFRRIKQAILKS